MGIMSIYEDVLNDFFIELIEDSKISNELLINLKEQLEKGQIKSNEIVDMIKKGDLDVHED